MGIDYKKKYLKYKNKYLEAQKGGSNYMTKDELVPRLEKVANMFGKILNYLELMNKTYNETYDVGRQSLLARLDAIDRKIDNKFGQVWSMTIKKASQSYMDEIGAKQALINKKIADRLEVLHKDTMDIMDFLESKKNGFTRRKHDPVPTDTKEQLDEIENTDSNAQEA